MKTSRNRKALIAAFIGEPNGLLTERGTLDLHTSLGALESLCARECLSCQKERDREEQQTKRTNLNVDLSEEHAQ